MYHCPYPRREPGAPMPINRPPVNPRPPPRVRPAPQPPAMVPPVPPPIAPVAPQHPAPPQPTPPPVENRTVNVIGLEESHSEDEKMVEVKVMPATKRTRGNHGKEAMEEDEDARKSSKESSREEPETSKCQRWVKKSRRKITIKDFPLGEGRESYSLLEDLGVQNPNITYPQLLELSPLLRKQWSKLSST